MAGNGANFCIAPLIRKPLTGQIAGLIGAYGSVGSVAFMTILLLTNATTFFTSMGVIGGIRICLLLFIKEPGRHRKSAIQAQTGGVQDAGLASGLAVA